MRLFLPALLIAILGPLAATSAEDLRAKTADGREVVLKEDGTWSFVEPVKPGPEGGAETAYEGKRKTFTLRLKPGTWIKADETPNPDAEAMFEHKDGEVYGMVIAERIAVPIDALKKTALAKLMDSGEDAKLVHEEQRNVDGVDVFRVTVELKSDDIPLTFFNSYYSGPAGSIQLVTWTGRNLFEESKPEMEKFLDSLVILKK